MISLTFKYGSMLKSTVYRFQQIVPTNLNDHQFIILLWENILLYRVQRLIQKQKLGFVFLSMLDAGELNLLKLRDTILFRVTISYRSNTKQNIVRSPNIMRVQKWSNEFQMKISRNELLILSDNPHLHRLYYILTWAQGETTD